MVELVGILNITPDSFSDGGLFVDPAKALAHAVQLFAEGASLVDVGAESTNPWSSPLTAEQEWERLAPVLPQLIHKYPQQVSLDTYHPETAEKASAMGDVIINDITGLADLKMIDVIAAHKARCIVSQMPAATPKAAHTGELMADINQIVEDLKAKRTLLVSKGVPKENIILDPGIGFGKTPELNRQLLEFAKYIPDSPVMIGYSRKRFLGEDRMELAPNIKAAHIAVAAGAAYLRVHDVAGHAQALMGDQGV